MTESNRRRADTGQWLIIADDLTGAADSAAAFNRGGATSTVMLDGEQSTIRNHPAHVLSLVVNIRDLDHPSARTELSNQLSGLALAGRNLFIKVDSMLRGHVQEMILAATQLLPEAIIVFSPAHPVQRRVTRNGLHYLGEADSPLADLRIFVPAETTSVLIGVDETAPGVSDTLADLAPGTVLIGDARTTEDLRRLVVTVQGENRDVVWVGSAGLAAALTAANHGATRNHSATLRARPNARRLVVVGSGSETASAQRKELLSKNSLASLALPAAELLNGLTPDVVTRYAAQLNNQLIDHDCAIWVEGRPEELSGRVSEQLTAVLTAAHRQSGFLSTTTLIVVGGATAMLILAGEEVTELDVVHEITDGVPLLIDQQHNFQFVTKAGEFGNTDVLNDVYSSLLRTTQLTPRVTTA